MTCIRVTDFLSYRVFRSSLTFLSIKSESLGTVAGIVPSGRDLPFLSSLGEN